MTERRVRSASNRRPPHRAARPRRRRVLPALVTAAVLLALVLFGAAVLARRLAPVGNTAHGRFDALIVLGAPADDDGNPSPLELARVTEAVHEYERGVAPRVLFTGGAAHNRFVEADVMARTAEAQGIPASAILAETGSRDTIQNACYADRILQAHGWGSAEIISSASHLPRAGLIFSRLPLAWHAHTAPAVEPGSGGDSNLMEDLKTLHYLVWARWTEPCRP